MGWSVNILSNQSGKVSGLVPQHRYQNQGKKECLKLDQCIRPNSPNTCTWRYNEIEGTVWSKLIIIKNIIVRDKRQEYDHKIQISKKL